MVDIKLRQNDAFRVETNQGNNFIDIRGIEWEAGICVQAYPFFHYIEVRKKDDCIATFYFTSKRIKKETDLGWWDDAEIVYSLNNVHHRLR